MTIKGQCIEVTDIQSGTKKDGEKWYKQLAILEMDSDSKYPQKMAIVLMGDKVGTIATGDAVEAEVNIESREFLGRWYTDVKAWRVKVARPEGASVINPEMQHNPDGEQELPF